MNRKHPRQLSVFVVVPAMVLLCAASALSQESPPTTDAAASPEAVTPDATGEGQVPQTAPPANDQAPADPAAQPPAPEGTPASPETAGTPPAQPGATATPAPPAAVATPAVPPTIDRSEPPPPSSAPAVRSGPRRMMLLIGPGFGFSFMYPKEINDYLDWWTGQQGAAVEEGTSAIFLSLQPRLALTFAPIEYVQIQFLGEIGWAPKVMAVIGGDSESFHFTRFSTGATVAGHIPVADGRRSVSFGAGALFNVLKFEGLQEIAPGYRGVFGFRFYGRRAFVPEIFVEFNWIRADTGQDPNGRDPEVIGELNYISGTIGGNFYFKVLEH